MLERLLLGHSTRSTQSIAGYWLEEEIARASHLSPRGSPGHCLMISFSICSKKFHALQSTGPNLWSVKKRISQQFRICLWVSPEVINQDPERIGWENKGSLMVTKEKEQKFNSNVVHLGNVRATPGDLTHFQLFGYVLQQRKSIRSFVKVEKNKIPQPLQVIILLF